MRELAIDISTALTAQVDQRFPTLCKHLTRHGVNVSSMALQWFLCMFVNSLPLESCFRVWDVLFFELSSSVLFRCGLALVDIYAQVSMSLPATAYANITPDAGHAVLVLG